VEQEVSQFPPLECREVGPHWRQKETWEERFLMASPVLRYFLLGDSRIGVTSVEVLLFC
jgi:hypothetical protein